MKSHPKAVRNASEPPDPPQMNLQALPSAESSRHREIPPAIEPYD